MQIAAFVIAVALVIVPIWLIWFRPPPGGPTFQIIVDNAEGVEDAIKRGLAGFNNPKPGVSA